MRKSFTMVELIVVMVIIGIIAVFSVPNFMKTINRARARDAVLNLNVIHASNVLYKIRNSINVNQGTIALINGALGLSINPNGATYVCNGATCVATNGGAGFTVTATLANPLCTTAGGLCPNPSCAGANCP